MRSEEPPVFTQRLLKIPYHQQRDQGGSRTESRSPGHPGTGLRPLKLAAQPAALAHLDGWGIPPSEGGAGEFPRCQVKPVGRLPVQLKRSRQPANGRGPLKAAGVFVPAALVQPARLPGGVAGEIPRREG